MSDSSTQQPQDDARLALIAASEYTPSGAPASTPPDTADPAVPAAASTPPADPDGTGFGNAAGQYAPAVDPRVRTVVYVAGLVASIVSAGFIAFGNPDVGAFIGSAAAAVTGAFGTAYNPISVARRSQLAALPDPAQPKHAA